MGRKRKIKDYYPEEELIDLVQTGVFGWFEYVYHYSPEWREDYTDFCRERGIDMKNDSNALAYITFREDLFEEALTNGAA